MRSLRASLSDRRARQRGSILGGLLIIVAMLAILIGALMTELSTSFMLSRNVSERVQREATVNSAMEWGLYQLANSSVPHVCARDSRGPWFLSSVNGSPAAVTEQCAAIVPDVATGLGAGAFSVAGMRETIGGRDLFLVGSQAGTLSAYSFGSTTRAWSLGLGGAPTGPTLASQDPNRPGHVSVLVPVNATRPTCLGHCVALYDQGAGIPVYRCDMVAAAAVTAQPASGANFPDEAFFGDAAGMLFVFDADSTGGCTPATLLPGLSGAIVSQPVVLPGTITGKGHVTTTVDDVFAVASTGTATQFVHWQYTEVFDDRIGIPLRTLVPIGSASVPVGGNAVASDPNTLVPANGAAISLAVAGRTGRIALARITATSIRGGFTYTTSVSSAVALAGQVTHDPYWCHCPGGDLIGVGGGNGFLYVLDTSLNVSRSYDGQADGRPAINSTPVADSAGDWYFGADDGFVYDVEIPASGVQMFKAARFGPGGAIRSSPVAGACGAATCVYFASTTAGAYFTDLASTRTIELRACVSIGPGSTSCAADPRLWARVTIGPPSVVGGRGISVQGWSYYSP